MLAEQLIALLEQPESACLEFKRELMLEGGLPRVVRKHKEAELAKDIMALANTFNHFGEVGYLIIGASDETERRLESSPGLGANRFSEQTLTQVVRRYCQEPVPFSYEELQLEDGRSFGVISVPKFMKPHEFAETVAGEYLVKYSPNGNANYIADQREIASLLHAQGTEGYKPVRFRYDKGSVYLRNTAHVVEATSGELLALVEEGRRLRNRGTTMPDKPVAKRAPEVELAHVIPISTTFSPDPHPRLDFVGRTRELKLLRTQLETNHVVCVEGLAGIGKTTLATQLAAELSEEYRVLWFDCQENTTLGDFLIALHHYGRQQGDLQLQEITSAPGSLMQRAADIVDYCESKGSFLFVFDDFHLINDPHFDEFMNLLADLCNRTRVLVCTRQRPKILLELHTRASEIIVRGLSVGESLEYMQLLGLKLETRELVDIHERVEGHPLATKLFISLVKNYHYSSRELLAEIPHFEQTLEAHWLSRLYLLLDEQEQNLMQVFSVFVGPVSRHAVAALVDDDSWIGLFNNLIDKFLIAPATNGLFAMHPLIREYSYKHLLDKTEAHRRAARYYLANYTIKTFQRDMPESEVQDKLKAYYHSSKAGMTDTANLIVSNIQHILMRWGQYPQLMTLIESAIDSSEDPDPWYFYYKARIYRVWGEFDKGLVVLNEIIDSSDSRKADLTESEKRERDKITAQAVHVKADILLARGRYSEAMQLLESNLNLLKVTRTSTLQAMDKMGCIFLAQGAYDQAKEIFNECLHLQQAEENKVGVGVALIRLGRVYQALEDHGNAESLVRASIDIFEAAKAKRAHSWAISELADIMRGKGDLETALSLYEQSLEEEEALNSKQQIAVICRNMAIVCEELGDLERAEALRRRKELLEYLEIDASANRSFGS